MNFIVLDFETANSRRASACEIGVTLVEDLKIIETRSWLIKPIDNHFDSFNTLLHGISADTVKDSPEFSELWEKELSGYLEDAFVIAHNASFDMSVLRHSLDLYHLTYPSFDYACSYIFSKKIWPGLASYNLKSLCMRQGIDFRHHRAGSDSEATAKLCIKAFEEKGIGSVSSLVNKLGIRLGQIYEGGYSASGVKKTRKPKEYDEVAFESNKEAEPGHPFYGRTIVFTGTLSIPRAAAQAMVAEVGGIVGNGVNQSTQYLVVGQQDYRVVGESGMSSKQEKALKMIEKGASLEILSEEEFFELI